MRNFIIRLLINGLALSAAAWLVARSETLDHPRGAWGHWVCRPDAELLGGG